MSGEFWTPSRPGLSAFVPEESRGVRFLVSYDPLLRECRRELAKKNFETLLDDGRLVAVLELSRHCAGKLDGELIELGVYKGGSAGATAWGLRNAGLERTLHLCDTFEGMPKTLEWEFHEENDFADTSLSAVRDRLNRLAPGFSIELHQGLFFNTLPRIAGKHFCFAHIDADLYESVKQACEFVYPRMTKGGVMLFDDYGAATCPGAKKAVDEFFAAKLEKPTHVALTSYGVVLGNATTNFSKLLIRIAWWRTMGGAAYRLPVRAMGRPAARALDSVASPTTSKILGRIFAGVRNNVRPTGGELREAETVLVIRPDGVGDLVLMSPFLRELRRSRKEARIILVVDERFANLMELCPWIDELQTIRSVEAGPAEKFRRYRQAVRFARKNLRDKGIDLALLPRWDVDYYAGPAMAYFSGAANRVGYAESVHPGKRDFNRGIDQLLTRTIDDRNAKHEVERNLDFLRAVGGNATDDSLKLWLNEEDRDYARMALESGSRNCEQRIIALAPGAGHPKRLWPLGRFIQLGMELLKEFDGRIIVVGGPGDQERASRLSEALGPRAISVAGQTTLRQTAAVLERTSLVIANDSGPMHLAAAAGVPVVEISCHPASGDPMHANSPQRFHPWGKRFEVVQPIKAQEPCTQSCQGHDAHCILGISSRMVLEAVHRLQAANEGTVAPVNGAPHG